MKHLIYLLFLFIFLSSGLISCATKEAKIASCSTNWATDLQDELTAVSNAGVAYATDPSSANCTAYKAAYQSYIDALEPYGDCSALSGQNRTAFEQALQDARDSISTLCND
jgi:uncharacterized membrane protein